MKAVCIFLAEGFEEMEAMFPLDIMRRGGLNVKTVSVTGNKTVISSHQVPIVADLLFEELKEEDVEMIVLPGGLPGATNLDAHAGLDKLICGCRKTVGCHLCRSDGIWQARFAERQESYLLSGFRQVPGRSRIYWKYGRSSRQLHFG